MPEYRWAGQVHEVITPVGKIVYSDTAVSHRKTGSMLSSVDFPLPDVPMMATNSSGSTEMPPLEVISYDGIYTRCRTPDMIKSKAAEIINTPDSGYASISLPEGTKQLRELFDKMPKDEIRRALCKEQHGLCAYCMRRIE